MLHLGAEPCHQVYPTSGGLVSKQQKIIEGGYVKLQSFETFKTDQPRQPIYERQW